MTTATTSTRAAVQAEIAAITALMAVQERVRTDATKIIERLSARRRELRALLETDGV